MIIHSYCQSFIDDADVLPDALSSLAYVSDRIFVVDGGWNGALCHHPRFHEPLAKSIFGQEGDYGNRRFDLIWPSHPRNLIEVRGFDSIKQLVPLTLFEHDFGSPGHQRNWIEAKMREESEQPDRIVWLDSDEVFSWEFIRGLRDYLERLPANIDNICPMWLNLVQDEEHCAIGSHSTWLSHARIFRPGAVSWSGSWHEHQIHNPEKRAKWNARVCHSRALFRGRLLVQRGHCTLKYKSSLCPTMGPLWDDMEVGPIPSGVSWARLTWPEGEEIVPWDKDYFEIHPELLEQYC